MAFAAPADDFNDLIHNEDVPDTGSATAGIAVFAVLSIAAAAAFVSKKN